MITRPKTQAIYAQAHDTHLLFYQTRFPNSFGVLAIAQSMALQ